MTPLAMKVARELTLPLAQRTFKEPFILELFEQEMHCFEVSSIIGSVNDALDEANLWPDVADILPHSFLPSPVTWLEGLWSGRRIAFVLTADEGLWSCYIVSADGFFGLKAATFRACSILEHHERIMVEPFEEFADEFAEYKKQTGDTISFAATVGSSGNLDEAAKYQIMSLEMRRAALNASMDKLTTAKDMLGAANRMIAFSILALDLINTPGLVGFRQHGPHRGFAKRFSQVGRYPLQSWSEVVVKTHTTFDGGEYETGATFRKCLHFVRSHQRCYRDGRTTVVCAHWRGDPALGIKRTRYRVAA